MRLTGIDLVTNDVTVAKVAYRMPNPQDKYLAKNVFGLDADEIVSKFQGFSLNGNKRYDPKLKSREIVMRLVLNPNYRLDQRYSDLRDDLYRAIGSNRSGELRLVFRSGGTSIAQITGRITKFETALMTNVPEVQITILCEDPMFRSVARTELTAADLLTTNPVRITDAFSTAHHGVYMEFSLSGMSGQTTFSMQDKASSPESLFAFKSTIGFNNGDIVRISSEYKNRFLTIERDAVVYPQADVLLSDAAWPTIFPGMNEFFFNFHAQMTWVMISYNQAYWGV